MGYSCSAKASEVNKAMLEILQRDSGVKIGPSNTWKAKGSFYFADIGQEQPDGAITCPVMKFQAANDDGTLPEGPCTCKRMGGIRIEPSGRIARWPSSTKDQRREAQEIGLSRFNEKFERPRTHGSDGRPMFEIIN